MIELIIKNYLDGHFIAPSFLERPEDPPEHICLWFSSGSEIATGQAEVRWDI